MLGNINLDDLFDFYPPETIRTMDNGEGFITTIKGMLSDISSTEEPEQQARVIVRAGSSFLGAAKALLMIYDEMENDWRVAIDYDGYHERFRNSEYTTMKFSEGFDAICKRLYHRKEVFSIRTDKIRKLLPDDFRYLKNDTDTNKIIGAPINGVQNSFMLFTNASLALGQEGLAYDFILHLEAPLRDFWMVKEKKAVPFHKRVPETDRDVHVCLMGEPYINTIYGKKHPNDFGHRVGDLFLTIAVQPEFKIGKRRAEKYLFDDGTDPERNAEQNIRTLGKRIIRFNEKFREMGFDDDLILQNRTEFYLNPEYSVVSDLDDFNGYCNGLKEVAYDSLKIRLLESMVDAYRNDVLADYDDHWVIGIRNSYRKRFIRAVYMLCELLEIRNKFTDINIHAAKAIHYESSDMKLYYWNILAFYMTLNIERGEANIRIARNELEPDKWKEMLAMLVQTATDLSCVKLKNTAESYRRAV